MYSWGNSRHGRLGLGEGGLFDVFRGWTTIKHIDCIGTVRLYRYMVNDRYMTVYIILYDMCGGKTMNEVTLRK